MTNLKPQEYSFLTQKKVEINGIEYTLQRIPFKFYMELNDRCTGKNGILQQALFGEEILKHVVVSPKVTLDSFGYDYDTPLKLVQEAENFLRTKPQQKPNTEESKG